MPQDSSLRQFGQGGRSCRVAWVKLQRLVMRMRESSNTQGDHSKGSDATCRTGQTNASNSRGDIAQSHTHTHTRLLASRSSRMRIRCWRDYEAKRRISRSGSKENTHKNVEGKCDTETYDTRMMPEGRDWRPGSGRRRVRSRLLPDKLLVSIFRTSAFWLCEDWMERNL